MIFNELLPEQGGLSDGTRELIGREIATIERMCRQAEDARPDAVPPR